MVLLPLCHLVQRAKRRYCRPLVFWARADSGRFLRVGMLIVIEDSAIVLSQNAGVAGRIGLHAAAAGGDDLLGVYSRLV